MRAERDGDGVLIPTTTVGDSHLITRCHVPDQFLHLTRGGHGSTVDGAHRIPRFEGAGRGTVLHHFIDLDLHRQVEEVHRRDRGGGL